MARCTTATRCLVATWIDGRSELRQRYRVASWTAVPTPDPGFLHESDLERYDLSSIGELAAEGRHAATVARGLKSRGITYYAGLRSD